MEFIKLYRAGNALYSILGFECLLLEAEDFVVFARLRDFIHWIACVSSYQFWLSHRLDRRLTTSFFLGFRPSMPFVSAHWSCMDPEYVIIPS